MKRLLALVAVAGIALLASPPTASAIFDISVNGSLVVDNGPGDGNPAVGVISYTSGLNGNPLIPGINLNVETAFTNSPGGPTNSILDVTWTLNAIGTTGGNVQVIAFSDGFTFPANGTSALLTSQIGGTASAGTTATGQQCVVPTCLNPQGPFSGAFSDSKTLNFTVSSPYALEEILNFHVAAGGNTTGDFNSTVTSVPEPATLLLLGAGLLGSGVVARWRRRN